MGRLVGVDLARALAVFGMYVVHIGAPLSATDGVASWIRYMADGHSSVLFATLAGFSLMLLADRREPKTGLAGRQAKARIAIRAVVLLALGTAMAMEYEGVIILGFYGSTSCWPCPWCDCGPGHSRSPRPPSPSSHHSWPSPSTRC
jgi:hypothetical protein